MARIDWDDSTCRISRYFTVGEACILQDIYEIYDPSLSERQNILQLASIMDSVRDYLDKPINVHSWIRPKEYNDYIGGAAHSRHLLGFAIDFDCGEDCDITRARLLPRLEDFRLRMEDRGTSWVHLDFFNGQHGVFTPEK